MKPEQPFSELKAIAKAVKIESYLSQRGVEPASRTKKKLWYKSPLRKEESNPSFAVNTNRNVWYDWGTNKKGDVIDLCMLLDSVSFRDAVGILTNGTFTNSFFFGGNTFPPKKKDGTGFRLIKTKALENSALISYLNSRKINKRIAFKYLLEVHYESTRTGNKYFSAGIKNNRGGFALRDKYMKAAISPAYYTTISKKGNTDLIIFEGFINSLSFLVWRNYQEFKTNVIILNGVNNTEKVLSCLGAYRKIYLFLDNDASGFEAAKTIQKAFPQAENWSAKLFPNYNDFNDFICKKLKH